VVLRQVSKTCGSTLLGKCQVRLAIITLPSCCLHVDMLSKRLTPFECPSAVLSSVQAHLAGAAVAQARVHWTATRSCMKCSQLHQSLQESRLPPCGRRLLWHLVKHLLRLSTASGSGISAGRLLWHRLQQLRQSSRLSRCACIETLVWTMLSNRCRWLPMQPLSFE
jgi:hypothetical protein